MANSKDNPEPTKRRRVVVTGMGAISPFGAGLVLFWDGLRRAQQAMGKVSLFDVAGERAQLAALVPESVIPQQSQAKQLSRTDHFALLAATEAWTSAQLGSPGDHPSAGLFFGTCTGGMLEGESAYFDLKSSGAERARHKGFGLQPNGAPAERLARDFGLLGPVEIIASACAAATMAIEAALDAIRCGEVELALAGGADGFCRTSFGGFNALRAIDPNPALPFRANRAGLSLGEGAGLLVLESEEHALARGVRPLAIVAGAASTCDAFHMTAPQTAGEGVARAMRAALRDANQSARSIDFLNTHGSGTPHNDVAEAQAIAAVFGPLESQPPVTSTKGAIGHGLGVCGALEAIATILCLQAGVVHPTPGPGPVDPETPVDLVLHEPRSIGSGRTGMSTNLAFGGANAALILQRWNDASRNA